jgi:signal transduction histidine kinase/DNA-binding response OmpR family regulator
MRLLIFLSLAGFLVAGRLTAPDQQLKTRMVTPDLSVVQNAALEQAQSDTTGIRILLDSVRYFQEIDYLKAERYAREAYQLALDIKSRYFIASTARLLAVSKKKLGEYVEVNNLLLTALFNFRKINDKMGMALSYNSLGDLHAELGNGERALDYFGKSIDMFRQMNDEQKVWEYTINIGTIYLEQDSLDNAYELFSGLIQNFLKADDYENLIPAYLNMGEVFFKKGIFDSTEYYCQLSLQLASKLGRPNYLVTSWHYLGRVYSQTWRFEESVAALNKAMALAQNMESGKDMADIAKWLSISYAALEDYRNAYNYLHLYESFEAETKRQEAIKNIAREALDEQNRISKTRIRLFYYAMVSLVISLLLVVAIYRNYRIKQKANQLLVEMDELKSRLFSNITHEFRTPLTLILGPLEEMLAAGDKKNPTPGEVKMMRSNAMRLLNLVNQMLDLARLDAKSMKLELSSEDFVRFFLVRVSAFISLAHQKDISISTLIPDEKLITWFDADKVEKIINNLVSNAIKYTHKGGEIICGLQLSAKSPSNVEFYVYDTGLGIPADQIEKIFDRFHQVGEVPVSDEPGTGIGLSLTKELVTLMHGKISVDSEAGRWSKFMVQLPLGKEHLKEEEYSILNNAPDEPVSLVETDDDAETENICDDASALKTAGRKKMPLVLIVEDQKDIREYLAENLRNCFRVIEAPDGVQGLESAVRSIPDLVITDLIMPEMDGLTLCEKLKTDERTSHVPVVMLTARSGIDDRLKGLETGADAYITKPFVIREIKVVCQKLIEQRKKLRERFSRNIRVEPKDIAVTSADERFLNRLIEVIDTHMGDAGFEVNSLQRTMNMSRMQLFRKIKALTNLTPGEFIRNIRIKRSAVLIGQHFGNIAEVCYEVGFSNPSYFAKCFKDVFGVLPSGYEKEPRVGQDG